MLDDFISYLRKIKEQLSEASCEKQEPFIKLGKGNAPMLNYNIPQTACFNTYGYHLVKGVPDTSFLPQARALPAQNYFDVVRETPEAELRQRFAEAVQLQRTDDVLIPDSALLRKHLSPAESNLKAVALGALPALGEVQTKATATTVVAQQAFVFDKVNGINEVQLARLAKDGLRPMLMEKMGGFELQVKFIKEPPKPTPYFAVIEEYTTCSYLGDYGAGRTIKTFSLLPGEKTTITVRTYKENTATASHAENVLDSFGESSTNELEKLIEQETGLANTGSSSSTNTSSQTKSGNIGGNVGVSLFGVVNLGVSGGTQSGSATSSTNSVSATRASNVRSLNKALDKHVSNSNANRSIDVNTSTTESYKEGEETATVRELTNINKSRVLNFVFRQLLQQYVTITYLSNIKIAYCNGYAESLRVVDLEELGILLEDTVAPSHIKEAARAILKPYCTVFNYQDDPIQFIEEITYNIGECLPNPDGEPEEETFWRIRKGIKDTWSADGNGLEISVRGPILNVTAHTLQTSSTVVDALLGQGEALDCYNMRTQDADAIRSQLDNIELLQQLEAIQSIEEPERRAELYKKVFGPCCDVPQTILGGCGCADNKPATNA